MPREERVRPGRIARLPDLRAGGVEFGRRPLRPGPRPAPPLLGGEGPFAGAAGSLRVGLLGCGDIGVENAGAIGGAPNVSLTACFDPMPALAEEVAAGHGAAAVPSVEELLGRDDVDAVFLAVPHHLHAPLAIQAAEAGKHVLVEKPPANDLAGAVAMVRAAERAGVALSVCFPHRYAPASLAARQLVDAGALGRFGGSLLTFLTDKPPSYWHGGFSGRAFTDWRGSRAKAGGGVLIMNLSHYLDLIRHVVGVEVEEVLAVAGPVDRPAEVEDTVSVSLRFANGAIGSVLGSAAVRGTWEGRTSTQLRLWGTDGHVSLEGREELYTLRAIEGVRPGRWQDLRPLPGVPMRSVLVSRFATAVAEGRAPDIGGADALAVQALMEAIYRSSETGAAVRPADVLKEAGW
ncbi:MAG: Gfo/Idh/MocA family oxidoreductase [Thermoleophilia bacterium]